MARLGWIWRRGRRCCLRGKRGTWGHRGHFAWQAWLTHNLSTHNLSHTTCHIQLVHAQLVHTQLHTQLVITQLAHTQLVHTQLALGDIDLRGTYGTGLALVARLGWIWRRGRRRCLRGRRGTWRHGLPLCVAGVALMALGWLWWCAWVGFGAVDAAAVCVAGVALGDIEHHFARQAWHLATWTFTLRGRRGTYGTGLALVARLGWIWRRGRRSCLRGRRGTWRHRASLCMAGVALGDMDLHFAWQA